jgi:hypothetical protein
VLCFTGDIYTREFPEEAGSKESLDEKLPVLQEKETKLGPVLGGWFAGHFLEAGVLPPPCHLIYLLVHKDLKDKPVKMRVHFQDAGDDLDTLEEVAQEYEFSQAKEEMPGHNKAVPDEMWYLRFLLVHGPAPTDASGQPLQVNWEGVCVLDVSDDSERGFALMAELWLDKWSGYSDPKKALRGEPDNPVRLALVEVLPEIMISADEEDDQEEAPAGEEGYAEYVEPTEPDTFEAESLEEGVYQERRPLPSSTVESEYDTDEDEDEEEDVDSDLEEL